MLTGKRSADNYSVFTDGGNWFAHVPKNDRPNQCSAHALTARFVAAYWYICCPIFTFPYTCG